VGKSKASPEIRAAALADLTAGEQPAVVAAKYGLDAAQVRVWKQRYVTGGDSPVTPVTPAPVVKPAIEAQHQRIGELVLELLSTKLEASQAVARAALDPEWRNRQTAAELAAFGAWLDSTAFAIGDRLAGRVEPTIHTARDGTAEPG
jgi:hypothetical protein